VQVAVFDYDLPGELIAQAPVEPRDASRLLVLDRRAGGVVHRTFSEIGEYLNPGDCLVLNDTRVLPARLIGHRAATGGKWQGLFLREADGQWELLCRTRGKPRPGERISLDGADFSLELTSSTREGTWWARPTVERPTVELLELAGHVPLPPYIRGGRDSAADRQAYQTVFARRDGAVAAPTAGLHFTAALLERLRKRGVWQEFVTLHVGPGTFRPVQVSDTQHHQMHSEWCELTPAVAKRLRGVRQAGGRIIAVGTTSVRVLETAASHCGTLEPFCGPTALFITPPYQFRAVDGLVTNFHLPKSTLLMLVCAFAGIEPALAAYRTAIAEGYRFYSYGDAMLVV
jgi:S-adenosylmethionine:tRNA ribosyltransferase-isomerase